MSFDLGVWYPHERLSHEEAEDFYARMNEGEIDSPPHPSVDAFYEEQTGDFDHCPWSCTHDRSPGHVIMACVWPKADYVGGLVLRLARKHGLALFDPQSGRVTYPVPEHDSAGRERPWWRFW
ncbi:MAG: hypothetical protein EOP88_15185 [Verrucomicrobiaceae bacterium]|nr:MAG: hypothetical protein EOP88_15185 [Verrucomicrobiaceae bacterium]